MDEEKRAEEKRAKRREYHRLYYHEHKERERERHAKWQEENKEMRREYSKRYYAEHREEILAKMKAKYWADPEQAREDGKVKWQKWIQNHPEIRKFKVQYNRHWRANNPDKVQEYSRRRREKLRAERERTKNEKMNVRKALFESRLRNVPKLDVLDRIRDLLEWRRLRKSLRQQI